MSLVVIYIVLLKYKECYVYQYKYDIISIYYMFFKIYLKKLPWEDILLQKETSKNIVYYYIKKIRLLDYYKDEEIVLKFVKSYIHFIYHDRIVFNEL